MAWAEAHLIAGAGIYGLAYLAGNAEPNIAPALLLSAMTHWPLDDLNVEQRSLYHGIGETAGIKVLTSLLRIPIWACLCYLWYQYPMALACSLIAWLICDHEWLVGLFIKRDYGLHTKYMWPKWLHTQWGLIPWFVAFGLFVWMLI